jgi:hypothetical protein
VIIEKYPGILRLSAVEEFGNDVQESLGVTDAQRQRTQTVCNVAEMERKKRRRNISPPEMKR